MRYCERTKTHIMEPLEIRDNTFSRQFEIVEGGKTISVEYSFQERKIFLTRINLPDGFDNDELVSDFLKQIMDIAAERKLKVVPTFPKIAAFFRKNPVYKELLPPGIKI